MIENIYKRLIDNGFDRFNTDEDIRFVKDDIIVIFVQDIYATIYNTYTNKVEDISFRYTHNTEEVFFSLLAYCQGD